jgi:hypothetical protein
MFAELFLKYFSIIFPNVFASVENIFHLCHTEKIRKMTNGKKLTIAEFSAQSGIKMEALRKRYRNAYPEKSFSKYAELSEAEILEITEKERKAEILPIRVVAEKPERPPVPTAEKSERKEKPTKRPRSFSLDKLRAGATVVVLLLIVLGHAGLIWYDCAIQWGTPGLIGGGMAALIALSASMLTFDSTRIGTAQTALALVFFIDAGAWFIHYATFTRTAQIGNIETGVFAGAICAMSFASLYILKEFKLETIFTA